MGELPYLSGYRYLGLVGAAAEPAALDRGARGVLAK
jgi:hypothetical protein